MKNFLEKVKKKGPAGRRGKKDRKGNRTRHKNKRGDSKVESNDSPEIPDRGETSYIPGLPTGWGKEDSSGSGARPLQWSQLLVPAVPVIALTTDITLTRRAHAEKGA